MVSSSDRKMNRQYCLVLMFRRRQGHDRGANWKQRRGRAQAEGDRNGLRGSRNKAQERGQTKEKMIETSKIERFMAPTIQWTRRPKWVSKGMVAKYCRAVRLDEDRKDHPVEAVGDFSGISARHSNSSVRHTAEHSAALSRAGGVTLRAAGAQGRARRRRGAWGEGGLECCGISAGNSSNLLLCCAILVDPHVLQSRGLAKQSVSWIWYQQGGLDLVSKGGPGSGRTKVRLGTVR